METLSDYSGGKLPRARTAELESHLQRCTACQQRLGKLSGRHILTLNKQHDADTPHPHAPPPRETAYDNSLSNAATIQHERQWSEGRPVETVADFLQCWVVSGLVELNVALATASKAPETASDVLAFSEWLIEQGKLTHYQAQRISAGLPRELLLADREILEPLGQGGMGEVFKARYRRLNRLEAIKVIAAPHRETPEARQRFAREAKTAAQIDHPNVVRIYDYGEEQGKHYLAMAYIDGCDLARLVRDRGVLPIDQAVNLILQAAHGLAAAHDLGIVHRDIKPHNMLLDSQGQLHVLDLGLARMIGTQEEQPGEALTRTGQIMGTSEYMSPEQMLDVRKASPTSDVYSLGCTLFYLLTGRPPYQEETYGKMILAHLQKPVPRLAQNRNDTPPMVSAIVDRMLAKNPENRIQNMHLLIREFQMLDYHVEQRQSRISSWLPPLLPNDQSDSDIDVHGIRLPLRPSQRPDENQTRVANPPTRVEPRVFFRRGSRRFWWIAGLVFFAASAAVLLTISLTVQTKAGQVTLIVDQENVVVTVDDKPADITNIKVTGEGKQALEIQAQRGQRRVKVIKNGFEVWSQDLTVQLGKATNVDIRLTPLLEQNVPPKSSAKSDPTAKASAAPSKIAEPLANSNSEEERKKQVEKLRETLVNHTWRYVDSLYPPGDKAVEFYKNGRFHQRWNWHYVVEEPGVLEIQFWGEKFSRETVNLRVKFNEDLTIGTGEFRDEKNRLHKLVMTRN